MIAPYLVRANASAAPALCEDAWAEIALALEGQSRDALFEPRQWMDVLLQALRKSGVKLGLVANQPTTAIAQLDRHGLGQFFEWREVSGRSRRAATLPEADAPVSTRAAP